MISSLNTGLSSWLHPQKSSFVLSWSSASATRTMKAQDTKRAFKLNFPNSPAIKPKAKFFEPQQIWYQNVPNSTEISKTIGSLGKHKHLCLTRNCAFSLPDSSELAQIVLYTNEKRYYSDPFSNCPETGLH